MDVIALVDPTTSSRELVRRLRTGLGANTPSFGGVPVEDDMMPESVAWQLFLELRKRGEPEVGRMFVGALRTLHSRRCIAGVELPSEDVQTDEHRLCDDAFLGDLWKAYKKCIRSHRTGPASQLLRDIEEQLCK
jgi:hypothetical protein